MKQSSARKADLEARSRILGELGQRILRARMELALESGAKVSQEELGILVGRYLGSTRPITGATVSRWESGETVPDLVTTAAIAEICGADPGWLAYGERSRAPSPAQSRESGADALFRAAQLGNLIATERTNAIEQHQAVRNREWSSRFANYEKSLRAARRIKDASARDARLAELSEEFAHLKAQNQETLEQATRAYLDAASLPRVEIERVREELNAKTKDTRKQGP